MDYIDPPYASKLKFYEYISTVMQNLVNKSIMFVGDFNIDILDEVSASEFSNIMFSHHFFPLIIYTHLRNRKCGIMLRSYLV